MKSISPTSLNIELRTIKAALSMAVRWNYIFKNPFARLALVRVPETAPVYFAKNDLQALIRTVKESWLKEIIIFAAMTGMRRGEIVNLQWFNVDMERRTIRIESDATFKTKLGRSRTIAVNEAAWLVLKERKESAFQSDGLVFSYLGERIPANWGTRLLKRYVRKLGYNEKLNFHSLRHTHCSWLVQAGVSLYEIQKLLGHSSITVTQIYAHLAPNELHKTVNRISLNL